MLDYIINKEDIVIKGGFIPTGGINLDNIQSFLNAGVEGLGIGSPLLDNTIINSQNWLAQENHFLKFTKTLQNHYKKKHKMKVVIQKDLFERSLEVFSNAEETYGIQFIQTEILDENTMLKQHTSGINCFVIGAEKYSRSFYNSLKESSAVIRYGVGYNAVPVDLCIQKNIKVAYTPGTLTDSVAEHTFALLLGVVRKLPELYQSVKSGNWKGLTGLELKNKTIAVIGYGQIGQAVAKIAKLGFGMKVVAYDIKEMKNDDLLDNYSNDFKSIVKNADIVSLHLATVPETLGFINKKRIDMLKDGSILINTARGELVVEKELHKALKKGKIKAAGLDVFENEPYHPNPEVDFRKLNNVVLTPHCSSNTKEASNKMAELVVRNILAYYSSGEMHLIPEIMNQIRKKQ